MSERRSSRPNGPPGTTRRGVFALGLAGLGGLLPGIGRAAHNVRPWPPERPVPELRLAALDGTAWRLDGLLGSVVLLNFWATWCEPCRDEMPSLEKLAQQHRAERLVVLTVNYRESATTVQRFLARVPLTLPILLDSDGEAASAWTPRVFPTTVVVDRTGMPRVSVVGELDWSGAAAHELLAPLLAARAGRPASSSAAKTLPRAASGAPR
jgi:thiol-disulfide isomerase/thioredoxin